MRSILFHLLAAAATVAASPMQTADSGCVVPALAMNTVPKPFSLMVHNPAEKTVDQRRVTVEKRDDGSFALMLAPAGEPAQLQLKDGKLYLMGHGPPAVAHGLPMVMIYPPPLGSLRFGGVGDESGFKFTSRYACDQAGASMMIVAPDGADGWGVGRDKSLRQELHFKPRGYAGMAMDVKVAVMA